MADRIDHLRQSILSAERGLKITPAGRQRLGVVYPNSYSVAMSNLAFQWLTFAVNDHSDFFAERIFLPDGNLADEYAKKDSALRTLESGCPATDCLAWLVTLSFENDFPNLIRLLNMARIEPMAKDRDAHAPLIVLGGTCPTLNPEPVAPFADVILLGEGDSILQPFLARLAKLHEYSDRRAFLESLSDLPFAYIPMLHKSEKRRVKIKREPQIHKAATHTHIFTPDTEFPNVFLIEAFRGCTARCRFCAAGHLYLPPRERNSDFELCDQGQSAIGLVGAGVSGHPDIESWIPKAAGLGRVGISSIRHGTLSEATLQLLVKQGTRSAAIAPEAGTERLRRVCNKSLSDQDILDESLRMIKAGFSKLKLYFMVGLPTETKEDIEAIANLAIQIRDRVMPIWQERKRAGRIELSVNPFVPKAHTPFQWAPFLTKKNYGKIKKALQSALGREGNIGLRFESYRQALLQAIFSMGDQRVSELVLDLGMGESPASALRKWKKDIDSMLYQPRATDASLAWDFIDSGIDRSYFVRENKRAMAGNVSPECNVGSCKLCGICE